MAHPRNLSLILFMQDAQTIDYEQTVEPDRKSGLVVAVVVPCYRVRDHIHSVLESIGSEVSTIYCVDDACPDNSAELIEKAAVGDPRIVVIRHDENQGVGGAVVSGYKQAVADGADIIVKLDGDGQMDASKIPALVAPIAEGKADYVKGNRFFRIEGLRAMPWTRLIGNAGLSFLTKLSTGYWQLFDPTNGFTAIHANVVRALPLGKISKRYFFESDMLFRLGTLRAVILDVPMNAIYGDERSNLNLLRALFEFSFHHAVNTWKRIFYGYFLRDFSMATIHLVLGSLLLLFGIVFGISQWVNSAQIQGVASSGTVMLAALPVILGVQFLLNFISFDMGSAPRDPIHRRILPDELSQS